MRHFTGLLLAAIVLGQSASAGETFTPNDHEIAIIQTAVAQRMLDPASTIISEVVAADDVSDDGVITWVCGNVRGRNSYGGYAQPTPFFGGLTDSPNFGRSFIVISIAGPSAREHLNVQTACQKSLREARPFGDDPEVQLLLDQFRSLDTACRSQPTASQNQACDDRNTVSAKLDDKGWCFGREGEAGYQHRWHLCGPVSLH
ncbi:MULTISPECIES: hypothetical protein [Salipiger]|uniref:hypothetical protein n=1 Tax=Salipiger TaxID=263377 RepID=UPI000FFB56AA|nr:MULTISPECIES: hypothetical protein [Salipiger]